MVSSVVTNMVVMFKVTTTSLVPCACPDGIDGCCVLHMQEKKTVEYVEPKVAPDIPAIVVDREDLHGVYEAWVGHYVNQDNPITYPIKICMKDGHKKCVNNTIVGLVNYAALAKSLTELEKEHQSLKK